MHSLSQSTPRTRLPFINASIHFVSGQFQGRCMRAELVEIQKADLGRKFARVDRRPLDPPPVVLLKLFHVYAEGVDQEYEQEVHNYEDIQNLGLLCGVDLFPVPALLDCTSMTSSQQPSASPRVSIDQSPGQHKPLASGALLPHLLTTHLDLSLATEELKCTRALSGGTFVQPVCVDHHGKSALVFPFADLAVKAEGDFFLRYRVFDLFSRTAGLADIPVLAECSGGPFHIYSTKEFPGLQPSTELSKQLSRYGVRLNTRETERKRKNRECQRSISPSCTSRDRSGRTTRKGWSECA